MKIAVSGASGLIGSALTQALKSRGDQVIRLTRQPNSTADCCRWIPESGLVEPKCLNGCDALVHLAGKSIANGRWTPDLKNQIRSSRVDATRLLAGQIIGLDSPPRTIISASAIGIYGDQADTRVDEYSTQGTDFLAQVARDWESACSGLDIAGFRTIHPRFGIVLSPDGGALQKMLPIFRFGLGGKLGAGDQYWSWISIEDCVRALVWMIDQPEALGPYNLVSPEPVTNVRFTQALAKAVSRPAWLAVPSLALRLAMGEMADALLLTSCRAEPKRLVEEGFEFEHANLAAYFGRALC